MNIIKKIIYILLITMILISCTKKNSTTQQDLYIAVFIPGVRSESPVYNMLAQGVEQAVNESDKNIELNIIEVGTNQSTWAEKLMAITAEEKYDLIISSNPSLPELINPISEQFPKQQFLIFDAFSKNRKQITSFRYNQREQGYIAGYISALVSLSKMQYANTQKKIGLIAGQEYPVMNKIILPAFLEGAKAVDPEMEVDFRVVGNWYDASKAAQLATSMYNNGCDVIMPICGGANQGVIATAKEKNFYISWFDDNGYSKAPGYVISSSIMEQKKLSYENTKTFIQNRAKLGVATTVGVKDGYVRFIDDDPLFIQTVPEAIRKQQKAMLQKIETGELVLPIKD